MTNKTKFTEQAYISGVRCIKRLYMETHASILAEKKDEPFPFAEQNFIRVAREIIAPGGLNLNVPGDTDRYYLNRTLRELNKKDAILYNAAFRTSSGEVARTDILIKDKLGVHLIELKMAKEMTDIHLHETSFKRYCMGMAGIVPYKVTVVYINRAFILRRNGSINDLKRGFLINRDVTRILQRVANRMPYTMERFRKVLNAKSKPDRDIGIYCVDPTPCPFKAHCWEHIPTNSIFDLREMKITRKLGLYYKGVVDMEQVVEKVGNKLSDVQTVQVASALRNSVVIRKDALKDWLDRLNSKSGVHYVHLDTGRSPIPLFDGDKPFSLNITGSRIISCPNGSFELPFEQCNKPHSINHKLGIILELEKKTCGDWPIVVYGRKALDEIIDYGVKALPEIADLLLNFSNRVFDLEEVFREKWYYDPRFKGSNSLSAIIEALFEQSFSESNGMVMIVKHLEKEIL
jgi:hypothetical protein